MIKDKEKRTLIPSEPIVILALIGIMLTGAILYYRSANLQRFLEPSLAVLEPRTRLSTSIRDIATEELGPEYTPGVIVRSTGLMVHKTMLLSPELHKASLLTERLGNFLLRLLEDPWLSANIDLILIRISVPIDQESGKTREIRHQMQTQSEEVLNTILETSPKLAQTYTDRFAATVVPNRKAKDSNWVTLDIIPSERLHIEILERLGQYAPTPEYAR